MSLKSGILLLVNILFVSILLSSCQSSKTAFGNSYYFKATPKTIADSSEEGDDKQAVASIESIQNEPTSLEERKEALDRKIVSLENRQKSIEQTKADIKRASTPQAKRAFRKEQRAEKKAFRGELKELVKDIRTAPEELQTENLSSNGRLGLIFAAIGLVLLLVVPGQVGYILGTILLVVGLLLLILDLV